MSLVIILIAIVVLILAYGWYARTIDQKIIQPDPKKATPAKMYMDGVDFIPASRNVLFGYQFKSIAALGPILGPIIALQWGWLPAILWILLGTSFIGWVQDYSSIIMGVREEGQTMGALSYRLISPAARTLLLIYIYFYLLMIMGAFGIQVGFVLLTNPAVPLGVIIVCLAGLLMGQMLYRWKQDIILTTVVTVIIAFVGIWLGTLPAVKNFFNVLYGTVGGAKSPILFLNVTRAGFIGSLMVLVFCYLGSVLPIWRWAQPINYVSFWVVFIGIIGGLLGLLIGRPGFGDFPAFTGFVSPTKQPLWPMLFVTIACGAISGWHSLVGTSGTARQLENEVDALPVGGGAMFLEMFFATMAFLAGTAAFGSFKGYQDAGGWGAPAKVFATGLSNFLNYWKIDALLGKGFGVAYGSVFLCLMALTIMHLVVRFMRVASAELLGDRFPILKNVHVGTIIALLFTIFFIWFAPFIQIWGIFGGANQLMAALALLLITMWLRYKGKNYQWTFWPFVFMYVTTIASLFYSAYRAFAIALPAAKTWDAQVAQITIGVCAVILAIAGLYLGWEALQAVGRVKPEAAKASK
jgi:carbon starvation protein